MRSTPVHASCCCPVTSDTPIMKRKSMRMGPIISTSYRRTGFGLYCLLLVASLASAADENIETRLARHRGRIVVLNFWATWCAPCIKEMPILVSLHRRYAARGVDVAGASADD